MIDSRHGANCASCREDVRKEFSHLGEALGGQLPNAGEETTLCRVDVDADGEEQVHEMHPSVLVNAYECYLFKARNRHLPQRKMREEGVQYPTCALLRSARRTVLADGTGVLREDCR